MPTLPPIEASDEEWRAFAEERCEELKPHVAEFILERFTYKPRYVQQRVWRTFATVSALSLQFDIYIRMFVKPNDYWPRECLVLARIGFTKERAGHGRALVQPGGAGSPIRLSVLSHRVCQCQRLSVRRKAGIQPTRQWPSLDRCGRRRAESLE